MGVSRLKEPQYEPLQHLQRMVHLDFLKENAAAGSLIANSVDKIPEQRQNILQDIQVLWFLPLLQKASDDDAPDSFFGNAAFRIPWVRLLELFRNKTKFYYIDKAGATLSYTRGFSRVLMTHRSIQGLKRVWTSKNPPLKEVNGEYFHAISTRIGDRHRRHVFEVAIDVSPAEAATLYSHCSVSPLDHSAVNVAKYRKKTPKEGANVYVTGHTCYHYNQFGKRCPYQYDAAAARAALAALPLKLHIDAHA